jgi:hypothetical protein
VAKRWDHKVVSINDSLARLEEVLCELGNDGFDLVGVVPIAHQAGKVAHAADDTLLIFKKPTYA